MVRHLPTVAATVALAAALVTSALVTSTPPAAAGPRPDALLTTLTGVVADRLATADTVAAAKRRTGTPVDDPAREAQVIAAAVAGGRVVGLDPARVTTVVRDQIEVGKAVQRTLIVLWRTVPATAPTVPVDLALVRPRITALTGHLVTALARDDAVLRSPDCRADLTRAVAITTTTHRLDPLHAVALAAASRSLCR